MKDPISTIQETITRLSADMSRTDYRQFLEEIEQEAMARIEALDNDGEDSE